MSAIQRLISFFVPNPSRASVTSLTHLPIRTGEEPSFFPAKHVLSRKDIRSAPRS